MSGITISYEEYGKLCDDMPKLSINAHRLPNEAEVGLLTSRQAVYFLGLSVWLLEKDGCIPNTENGMSVREMLNDQLDSAMETITVGQETPGKKIIIEYNDYEEIYDAAHKIGFIQKGAFPTLGDIRDVLIPNMKFCFGLALVFLFKNPAMKDSVEYKALKEAVIENYALHKEQKTLEISEKDYQDLSKRLDEIYFPREGWWPTMDDVEKYIRPNYVECFDFILWLLRTGKERISPEEKAVYRELEKLVSENTLVTTGRNIPWL